MDGSSHRDEADIIYFSLLHTEKNSWRINAVPTINFVRENIKVEVPEGDQVRYPALENDVPVYQGIWKIANCHGNGLCATDKVVVTPASNVSEPNFLEKFRLGSAHKKNPNLRLACQVAVYGDIEVQTLAK